VPDSSYSRSPGRPELVAHPAVVCRRPAGGGGAPSSSAWSSVGSPPPECRIRRQDPRHLALRAAARASDSMARHADLTLIEIAGQVRSTAADIVRASQAGAPDEADQAEASTEEVLAEPLHVGPPNLIDTSRPRRCRRKPSPTSMHASSRNRWTATRADPTAARIPEAALLLVDQGSLLDPRNRTRRSQPNFRARRGTGWRADDLARRGGRNHTTGVAPERQSDAIRLHRGKCCLHSRSPRSSAGRSTSSRRARPPPQP